MTTKVYSLSTELAVSNLLLNGYDINRAVLTKVLNGLDSNKTVSIKKPTTKLIIVKNSHGKFNLTVQSLN